MSNQNKEQKMGKLTLEDLSGLSLFDQWLRSNLAIYKDSEVGTISFDELLIFLNYIEEKASDFNNKLDRKKWKKSVSKLKTHIQHQMDGL